MNAFLMATAMAFSPPVPADQPAPPAHEVRPGESLSQIAQCELGDRNRWVELVELNAGQIADPDLIEAGWLLALPEEGSGECPERPLVPARASSSSRQVVTRKGSGNGASRQVKAAARTSGGGKSGGNLAGIRNCESSGDYGAVSSNGQYRGAYQFDRQTWQSVGGSGDPAAASAEEQDRRASALYARRGGSAWPSCA